METPTPPVLCPTCGSPFSRWGRGGQRNFCSPTCRQDFAARAKVEGALIVQLAKAWRAERGGGEVGKAAFQELCTVLDMLNARDREAGRPPVTQYVRRALLQGRTIDRLRS